MCFIAVWHARVWQPAWTCGSAMFSNSQTAAAYLECSSRSVTASLGLPMHDSQVRKVPPMKCRYGVAWLCHSQFISPAHFRTCSWQGSLSKVRTIPRQPTSWHFGKPSGTHISVNFLMLCAYTMSDSTEVGSHIAFVGSLSSESVIGACSKNESTTNERA